MAAEGHARVMKSNASMPTATGSAIWEQSVRCFTKGPKTAPEMFRSALRRRRVPTSSRSACVRVVQTQTAVRVRSAKSHRSQRGIAHRPKTAIGPCPCVNRMEAVWARASNAMRARSVGCFVTTTIHVATARLVRMLDTVRRKTQPVPTSALSNAL